MDQCLSAKINTSHLSSKTISGKYCAVQQETEARQHLQDSSLRTKLLSETGASLSVALLFFIMCAVVGSVILAAAGSTAGRISRIKGNDKVTYALDSATDMVKKMLTENDNNYVRVYPEPSTSEEQNAGNGSTENSSEGSSESTPPEENMKKWQKKMAAEVVEAHWTEIASYDPDPGTGTASETSSGSTSRTNYASTYSPVVADRDNTNVITLVPNNENKTSSSAQDSENTTDEFDITLNDHSDYPVVHAKGSMDAYCNITIILSAEDNSDPKDPKKQTRTLVINADPAVVQYDWVLLPQGKKTSDEQIGNQEDSGEEVSGDGSTEKSDDGNEKEEALTKRITYTMRWRTASVKNYDTTGGGSTGSLSISSSSSSEPSSGTSVSDPSEASDSGGE